MRFLGWCQWKPTKNSWCGKSAVVAVTRDGTTRFYCRNHRIAAKLGSDKKKMP